MKIIFKLKVVLYEGMGKDLDPKLFKSSHENMKQETYLNC